MKIPFSKGHFQVSGSTKFMRSSIRFSSIQEKFSQASIALEEWPWRDMLGTLYLRFREDRLGLVAGSLTFTTLISLVPLLTVMLAIFAAFPVFSDFQAALEQYFLRRLIPEDIAKPVLRSLTQFSSKAQGLGALGVVFLIISVQALMLTIDRTLNTIWRIRQPRPFGSRMVLYWAAATLGPLLLGGSLSVTSYVVSASRGWVSGLPGGVAFFLGLIQFLWLTFGLTALFRFVPNTYVRWRHAFLGAMVAMVGFELMKRGLSWYLNIVPTYAIIYGAFATVPILLIWIFLSWNTFLMGAVIAAYAPSLNLGLLRYTDVAGARFQLALSILRLLAHSRSSEQRGLRIEDLSKSLQTDPLQMGPILDQLISLDWVARLDEPKSPRYVLICEPEKTLAAPLITVFLLEPSPDVMGLWNHAHFDKIQLQTILLNKT